MTKIITFILSNFTLTFFVLGFLAASIVIFLKRKKRTDKDVPDALLAYFILFNIGFAYLYNFVCHVFFAEQTAKFIGWANSPFQLEVGFASLGFAVVGLAAFRGGAGLRTASILGPTMFLWGAAGGHVDQMVKVHNFSPGNAGVVFWSDILLPIVGFILLWYRYRGYVGHGEADPLDHKANEQCAGWTSE